MDKKISKKSKNWFETVNYHSPYTWWGLIVLIIGVVTGGAIGGATGGLCGYSIIGIGNKKMSHSKKIVINSLITLGGILVYLILVMILYTLIY